MTWPDLINVLPGDSQELNRGQTRYKGQAKKYSMAALKQASALTDGRILKTVAPLI